MSALKTVDWQWQNAVAGSVAGLATVAFSHPLDVVRTRFQGLSLSIILDLNRWVNQSLLDCVLLFNSQLATAEPQASHCTRTRLTRSGL